jgi:hypothetical protein
VTDLEQAHDLLHETAASIARDVKYTYPDMSTDYDVWIENGIMTEIPSQYFGVIDMGDSGQWVYQLVEHDRYDKLEWIDVSGSFDPVDIKHRIIAKRNRPTSL